MSIYQDKDPESQLKFQLLENEKVIENILGQGILKGFIRPPHLEIDPSIATLAITTGIGYKIIQTNLNTNDFTCDI